MKAIYRGPMSLHLHIDPSCKDTESFQGRGVVRKLYFFCIEVYSTNLSIGYMEDVKLFVGPTEAVEVWIGLENSNRPLEHIPRYQKFKYKRIPCINRCGICSRGLLDSS